MTLEQDARNRREHKFVADMRNDEPHTPEQVAWHILDRLAVDDPVAEARLLIGHDRERGLMRVAVRDLTATDLRLICNEILRHAE